MSAVLDEEQTDQQQAGPWQDYKKPAAPAASDGPWADYAKPKPPASPLHPAAVTPQTIQDANSGTQVPSILPPRVAQGSASINPPTQQPLPLAPPAQDPLPFTPPAGPPKVPQAAGSASLTGPAPDHPATISAYEPGPWDEFKSTIANSAIGRTLQSVVPKVAAATGLQPSESLQSPTYEQHGQQLVVPEEAEKVLSEYFGQRKFNDPSQAPSAGENRITGALTAAGGLTSGKSMATIAGTAIAAGLTAGVVNPATAQVLSRLASGGFSADMLYGLYQQHGAYKKAVDSGNLAEAQKIQGEMGVNGVLALLTAAHAAGVSPHAEMTRGDYGARGVKVGAGPVSAEAGYRPAYREPGPWDDYGEGSTVVPSKVSAGVTVGGKRFGTAEEGPWSDYAPAAPVERPEPKELTAGERPVVQASTDPAEIRESAAAQEKPTVAAVEKAVEDVPGAEVNGSRVKDEESQQNKADRDKPVETQKDHLGVRVAVDTPEAHRAAVGAIAQTMPVVGTEPLDNNGLEGTQVFVQTGRPGEANAVSEIQVVPKSQVEAMKETDKLYDQQKEALAAGDTEKSDALGKQIKEIHEAALKADTPVKSNDAGTLSRPEQSATSAAPLEGGRGESPERTAGVAPTGAPAAPTKSDAQIKTGATVKLPDGRTGVVKGISPKGDVEVKLDSGGRARSTRSAVQVIQPEMVTLYRGESTPGTGKPIPAWIQSSDKFKKQQEAVGRWFTPSLENAKFYQQDAGESGRITSVQVPKSDLDRYSARNNPDAARFIHHTKTSGPDAKDEYFLPRDIAAKAKPVESVPSQVVDKNAPEQGVTVGTPGHETPSHGAIATDLDKTLAEYTTYKGPTVIGEPIPAQVEQVKQMLADGEDVWIYTARAKDAAAIPAIQAWSKEHIGQVLPITNVKYSNFARFIDDRSELPVQMREGGKDAVQERGAAEVLQREQGQTGEAGRGRERVEPVEQGAAPATEKPQGKVQGNDGRPQGSEGSAGGREEVAPRPERPAAEAGKEVSLTEKQRFTLQQMADGKDASWLTSEMAGALEKKGLIRYESGNSYRITDAGKSLLAPKEASPAEKFKAAAKKRTAPKTVEKVVEPAEPERGVKEVKLPALEDVPVAPSTDSPAFKKWFGDSKVVDADGKPQVVYHGTGEDFTKFDLDKTADGTIWFTSDKAAIEKGEAGASHSGKIIDLYAKIQNPAGWDEYDKYSLGELQGKGYDGVILPEADGSITGFVFEPTQLKSASANSGAFDEKNPDFTDLIQPDPAATKKASDLGSTFYSGFADPELFKRLFPDVADRIKEWKSNEPTAGDKQRAVMRQTRGEMDRSVAVVMQKLSEARRDWTRRSRADSMAFWNAVESGNVDSLPAKDQALAKLFKGAFDQMRGQIQELKPEALKNYIENYFPHLWDRPSQVSAKLKGLLNGKTPFAGKASFLKQRTIPTMQEGIDLGFKPKTWNPVESFLMKYAEMAQFLMGHQTLAMMKGEGTAKFVRVGETPPDGWTQLDDRMGTVYGREEGRPAEGEEKGAEFSVIRGHYYAPADAARIFNNFVSRGLAGRSGIYDTLNWMNQNLNALQLGISAFHATTTTINAAASDIALGLEQIAHGHPLKAGASFLKAPATIINTFRNGSKLMQEYLDPGSLAKLEGEAKGIAEAGGRIKQNVIELKPLAQVINALRNGAIGEAALKVPAALLQASVAPVMEWYVPRMKLGAFYSMAHDILADADKKGWTHDEVRRKMQRAWDSVDDRFGQVVYENLFWHKALRDTLQLVQRSVGWNYGTLRTYAGAAGDTARAGARAASGEMPDFTPRMAFAIASFIVSGLVGALLTKLWTGENPQSWKDYYFPRKADGTRVSTPGYPTQVVSFAQNPETTVANKMAPIWSMMIDAVQNRDFYGTEIRHKDDPAVKQLGQVASWLAKQTVPFSISGSQKLLEKQGADDTLRGMWEEAKEHPGDVLLGNFGFQPAPAYAQNSEALNLAREYNRDNRPPGTKTAEQTEHLKAFDAIVQMYRTGSVDRDKIQKMVNEGKIDRVSAAKAALESRKAPIVLAASNLDIEQILNVYDKATPEEKKQLQPLVAKKYPEIRKIEDPDRKEELQTAYERVVHDRTQTAAR